MAFFLHPFNRPSVDRAAGRGSRKRQHGGACKQPPKIRRKDKDRTSQGLQDASQTEERNSAPRICQYPQRNFCKRDDSTEQPDDDADLPNLGAVLTHEDALHRQEGTKPKAS